MIEKNESKLVIDSGAANGLAGRFFYRLIFPRFAVRFSSGMANFGSNPSRWYRLANRNMKSTIPPTAIRLGRWQILFQFRGGVFIELTEENVPQHAIIHHAGRFPVSSVVVFC
jgi:hypothetical protein